MDQVVSIKTLISSKVIAADGVDVVGNMGLFLLMSPLIRLPINETRPAIFPKAEVIDG